jgi:hypothetical protein
MTKKDCESLIIEHKNLINSTFVQINSNRKVILIDLLLFPIIVNKNIVDYEVLCLFNNPPYNTVENLSLVLKGHHYRKV